MRRIIESMIVVGLFLFLMSTGQAQCPPERLGCMNPINIQMSMPVILSTGCVVEVAYRIRKCEDKPCEVILEGMVATYSTDGCQQCDPVLDGTSLKQVTDEVLRRILSRNRGTVPCGSVSGQQVSVSRPTCWQHAVVAGRRVYAPCGGCCIVLVNVVTNNQYTRLDYIGPDPDIASIPCAPPPPTPPCAVEMNCPPEGAGDPNNWLFGIDQY